MSDLDPEMIEKVAIATYDAMQHPNWRAPLWGEIDELGRERFLNVARAALEAVADDLRAEGAVKALRDAADRLNLAALAVDSKHHIHGTTCLCGFEGNARKRTQTEHITAAVIEEYNHD